MMLHKIFDAWLPDSHHNGHGIPRIVCVQQMHLHTDGQVSETEVLAAAAETGVLWTCKQALQR